MKWIWFSSKKTFLKGMVCFFLSTYSKFHFLLHVWHRLLTTIKLFCVRYAKSQTERERRKFLVRLSLTSLLFLKSIIANYIFVDLFYEAHNKISKVKILCLKCIKIIRKKWIWWFLFCSFYSCQNNYSPMVASEQFQCQKNVHFSVYWQQTAYGQFNIRTIMKKQLNG